MAKTLSAAQKVALGLLEEIKTEEKKGFDANFKLKKPCDGCPGAKKRKKEQPAQEHSLEEKGGEEEK